MSDLQFTEDGWEDFSYWLTEDRKTMARIVKLIADIKRNGYRGIGKPSSVAI